MDVFRILMIILLNWNTWSLADLEVLMFQEQEESEDSFWAVVQFICSSTSDSTSEVNPGRKWWIFPKSESWWEILVKKVWDSMETDRDQLWRIRFRMSYDLFVQLVDLIEPFMPPLSEWPLARKRLELEKCVALVVYRLAHNVSLVELSDKFHVGQAGCVKYTRIIIEILSNRSKLHGQFIGLPRGDRIDAVIGKFQNMSGVPLVAGVIDGCQIRLKKKPEGRYFPAEYWNRHHHHSVLLQGVSDADRNFLDVACLLPGSQHDATHLRVSSLWYKLTNNLIFQAPQMTLGVPAARRSGRCRLVVERITVYPFLLGDAAYPLTSSIIKAFDTRRTGTQAKNEFDKALRRCRVRIEHTFGLLKSRWRILDTGCPLKIEDVSKCVIACCITSSTIEGLKYERQTEKEIFFSILSKIRNHSSIFQRGYIDKERTQGRRSNELSLNNGEQPTTRLHEGVN